MRTALLLAVAGLLAAPAGAHTMSEHGSVTAMTLGTHPVLHEVFALVESIAPGTVPNGLFYYALHGVQSGDSFRVTADDGQEPFFIDQDCDPASDSDQPWEPGARPTDPGWWESEWVLLCNSHPDFDVYCGGHRSRPGDEAGTVDCGTCVVYLVFGDPGEGFTYSES